MVKLLWRWARFLRSERRFKLPALADINRHAALFHDGVAAKDARYQREHAGRIGQSDFQHADFAALCRAIGIKAGEYIALFVFKHSLNPEGMT